MLRAKKGQDKKMGISISSQGIIRLQDAGDVNVSLGAGVDEYALTWDNDTARFVLRAPFTGGLLATGATIGATNERQVFTNGISGPSWRPVADSTTALQLQNAAGTSVLNVDTTNSRVGIGTAGPLSKLQVEGSINAAGGNITTGAGGMGAGLYARHTGLDAGVHMFSLTRQAVANGDLSVSAFGGIGLSSGKTVGPETTAYQMYITNAGNVGIGTTTPGSLLHALLTSTATAAVTNVLTIGHNSTGTAASAFGAGQLFTLQSSTTAAQSAARIQAITFEATHATRKYDLVGTAFDSGGEREGWRVRGNGSAPAIAFLGGGLTPSARKAHVADPLSGVVVDAEARSAINSILVTLEDFGFHATS